MANFKEFTEELKKMFRARIPFISINSIERNRVFEAIKSISEDINLPVYIHSLSHGTRDIRTKKVVNEDRSIAGGLDFAVQMIANRQNMTFVFTEVSDIEDDNVVSRHFYDAVSQAIEQGGSIWIITNKPVWQQLQRMGMTIELEVPDENEMLEIVNQCISPYKNVIDIEWDDKDIKVAAGILSNLTKIEAENVLTTQMAKGALKKEDILALSKAKEKLFTDISGLEKIKIDPELISVAGLEGLKKWLNDRKKLLTADLSSRKIKSPRGVLLVGVPGCGKSLSAKYIAASWNLPLYRLDLTTIQGRYLGQSEDRLKEALKSADKSAPCILWIDEIEKGLAGVGSISDSGTSTRMVGQFLFWLQESTARVFVVATANDIALLPPELLRKGRFDEIFFVDLPNSEERQHIIKLYIKKYKLKQPSSETLKKLEEISDGFSGADIEGTIKDIAYQAIIHENDDIITDEVYLKYFNQTVPLSKTAPELIEIIRNWGKERAIKASGKQWKNPEIDSRQRNIIL